MVLFLMSCCSSSEDAKLEAGILLTNVAKTVDAELALRVESATEPSPTEVPTLEHPNTMIPATATSTDQPIAKSIAYVQPIVSS